MNIRITAALKGGNASDGAIGYTLGYENAP